MLRPQPIDPIPSETVRVAPATLPANHRYLCLADELGPLFTDDLFAGLFLTHGPPQDTTHLVHALDERHAGRMRPCDFASSITSAGDPFYFYRHSLRRSLGSPVIT
jgi:hypothetical protein